jgi:hypothetical protein
VSCDVTLGSMPMQSGVNWCYSVLAVDGEKWPTLLHSCNLRLFLLIAVFEFGTRGSEI